MDSIDYTFHNEQDIITASSPIHEHGIATTSSIIHEQEIEIESSTSSNVHTKSKVWDYFTKPYGPPKVAKQNVMNYHLSHRHRIDVCTNLSQVKRQSLQIPSHKLSVNENSLLQSSTISLAIKKIGERMGEYEESIPDYSRAIEIEPNNVNALISGGEAYGMIEEYEESIADLSRALEIEPNNIDAFIIVEIEPDNVDALKNYSKAIENEPDYVDASILKGEAYKRMEAYKEMRKYEESIVDLSRALELEPEDTETLQILEEI
ncbi:6196_t:CDS:2 [Diversispora eburnea]|uniref:6196_t:CDS:1 n=1 Tax=Diversispora eburnea TaxID=1213867 RepID=A0A9N9C6I0_9GLOM|nr:6196_t:CDS:2 [Diversispora eburnea]